MAMSCQSWQLPDLFPHRSVDGAVEGRGCRLQPNAAWSAGRPCAAPDEGLHETFARRARARPDAVALVDGERAMTYEELDRTADAWAARLAAAGAGAGDLVPVLLPRGTRLVVAL